MHILPRMNALLDFICMGSVDLRSERGKRKNTSGDGRFGYCDCSIICLNQYTWSKQSVCEQMDSSVTLNIKKNITCNTFYSIECPIIYDPVSKRNNFAYLQ